MEVSALKYHGGLGLHSRTPLLRLQSDERLVAYVRRGNAAAFETLVCRYESRLLAFCRHLLGSREDAEDILQEVLAAAFNAILADDRPIKVRPWLYRIARNRSLNHLRRNQAVGVDSMDVHFSDNGASTADKVHDREEFRLLVGDIQDLPETQRTALVLREMDALSYDQIAEAMDTTVPSVKSLLVRARVSLAEAAEARLLSCDQVRLELGEVAEGLRRRPSALVRRHLRACERCSTFRVQLRDTNKALAALLPFGPLVVLKKLVFTHLGHSAGSSAAGSGAGTAGSTAAGSTAAGGTALGGSAFVASGAGGSLMSAGIGAVATKAAAGIAAAALVTAGAVEVDSSGRHVHHQSVASVAPPLTGITAAHELAPVKPRRASHVAKPAKKTATSSGSNAQTKANVKTSGPGKAAADAKTHALRAKPKTVAPPPGRTVTTTDSTNLQSGVCGSAAVATASSDPAASGGSASCSTTTTTPTTTTPTTTTTTSTTTTPTTTTPTTTTPTTQTPSSDGTTTPTGDTGTPSPQDGSPPANPPQGPPPQSSPPQGSPPQGSTPPATVTP